MEKNSIQKLILFNLAIVIILFVAAEIILRIYDITTGKVMDPYIASEQYEKVNNAHPFLRYTSVKNFNGKLSLLEPDKLYHVTIKAPQQNLWVKTAKR